MIELLEIVVVLFVLGWVALASIGAVLGIVIGVAYQLNEAARRVWPRQSQPSDRSGIA